MVNTFCCLQVARPRHVETLANRSLRRATAMFRPAVGVGNMDKAEVVVERREAFETTRYDPCAATEMLSSAVLARHLHFQANHSQIAF